MKEDDNRILRVTGVDPVNLNWSNIQLVGNGTCNLPIGNISAGDAITDCTGTISLKWIPTNKILGSWDFPE